MMPDHSQNSPTHLLSARHLVLALVIVISACGSSTSTSPASDLDVSPSTTSSDTIGSTSSSSQLSSTTTGAPPVTIDAGTMISAVVAGATSVDQWTLEPGTWTSTAFSTPVTWTSLMDLQLIREAAGFSQVRSGNTSVMILDVERVADAHGWSAYSGLDPDQLAARSGVTVVDGGTVAGGATNVEWADFTIDSSQLPEGWPCEFAPEISCHYGLASSGFSLDLPLDTIIRWADATVDDAVLSFITFGDRDSTGPMAEEVLNMASSAQVGATVSEDGMSFISTIGNRVSSFASGTYTGRVADTLLTFDFDTDVDDWHVNFSGFRTLGFSSTEPAASLFIIEFSGLIDPAAAQVPPPDFPEPTLGVTPTDVEGVEEWLGQMVSIVDSGDIELGGLSARWWDVTVDESVASSRCGLERDFNPDAQCVTFLANELAFGQPSSSEGRVFYVPDANLWLQLQPQDPSGLVTLEDAIVLTAPLIDALTIHS